MAAFQALYQEFAALAERLPVVPSTWYAQNGHRVVREFEEVSAQGPSPETVHRLTELYARFRADYDELNGLVRQLAAWAELVGQGLGLVNRAPVQEPAGGAWQAAGTGPHR